MRFHCAYTSIAALAFLVWRCHNRNSDKRKRSIIPTSRRLLLLRASQLDSVSAHRLHSVASQHFPRVRSNTSQPVEPRLEKTRSRCVGACGPAPGACSHFCGACGPFFGACGLPLLRARYLRVLPASTDWYTLKTGNVCISGVFLPVPQSSRLQLRTRDPGCRVRKAGSCLLATVRAAGPLVRWHRCFSPPPTHGPVTALGSLAPCSASSFSRAVFATTHRINPFAMGLSPSL
ncbi:hypothetical protein K438DRAFT_1000720 [Mycena galopus ATCC 62051]|nr:hypothetical protein K438DRAFT_1000720 [Mycena galopus ATCC 62051]